MLGKLSVLAVTLLTFFGVGELGMRWYISRHIIYDIEMSRYAAELKMPSNNPRIGHVHIPGKRAHLMNVTTQINSDGLRDKDYSVEKQGARRIAFLGDSLTFGWGVSEEHTFQHRMEEILSQKSPTEIINFGHGNYNTEQEVNLFLEKGLKYRPDKVVVFYFINDAEPTPKKSQWAFLENSRLITFYWSRFHQVKNRFFTKANYKTYYSDLYQDHQAGWRATRDAFLTLKETCLREKIELQVVLLPELHELVRYPFSEEYGKVEGFLKANQIPVQNLLPVFSGETEPTRLWVSLDDAHPNSLAHEMIAKGALDFIAGKQGAIH